VDGTVESEIVADLSRLEKDLERATDMRLRLAAEFDNYRKRVERERADLFERAQGELAKRLLDSIDDLDRVSEFGPETPISAMLEGVQLVERKLLAALGSAGLEEVVAAGRPFDPNEMEAVAAVSTDDPAQDDHVLDVFQKGWRFHGQLIRPARVRVMQFEA
jgi:molecular chaperone GrpE